MEVLPQLGDFFVADVDRNVRVRGLFGPLRSNGRVRGLLGVQWWQHQSNGNSTKVRAPFSFYGSLCHS